MLRFRDNDVFLLTGTDDMMQKPLGALHTVSNDGCWKSDHGFLLAFNSNFISIMQRFRKNDVFLLTGNYVMVIFQLGGAVHNFRWWILKRWHQVYLHALLTYFAYLQLLTSYPTFSFWLGFLYCRRNLWGFSWKMIPRSQNSKKNAFLEGTSLCQTAFFELSCMKISSRVWAVCVARI